MNEIKMDDRLTETLVILQEECAEVVVEVSKCFRFGINGTHKSGIPHRDMLEQEIGDVLAMVELLIQQNAITEEGLIAARQRKLDKLKIYSNILSKD